MTSARPLELFHFGFSKRQNTDWRYKQSQRVHCVDQVHHLEGLWWTQWTRSSYLNTLTPVNPFTELMNRESFIELNARDRALALLDRGTFREILGPFDRVESPWLERQGITPQSDDGTIVARGRLN